MAGGEGRCIHDQSCEGADRPLVLLLKVGGWGGGALGGVVLCCAVSCIMMLLWYVSALSCCVMLCHVSCFMLCCSLWRRPVLACAVLPYPVVTVLSYPPVVPHWIFSYPILWYRTILLFCALLSCVVMSVLTYDFMRCGCCTNDSLCRAAGQGAPERVWELCSSMLVNGEEVAVTPQLEKEFLAAYEKLGSLGERVLGFAYR